MSKLVLVEWVEDPKPECWDVIKINQFPKPEDVKEGAILDAYWGEETAVAKVLKINESKKYLISVKENEFFIPWKNSVPPKRIAVPKKSDEFVTSSADNSLLQEDDVPAKKRRKNNKTKKGLPKKKNKQTKQQDKIENEELIAESCDENDTRNYSAADIKSSKDEAEKVLAASFVLKKSREQSPVIPEAIMHKKKQVSPLKTTDIHDDDSDKDLMDNAVAFGLPQIKDSAHSTPCCGHCHLLRSEVSSIKADLAELRKKIKTMRKNSKILSEKEHPLNDLESDCREAVANATSVFATVNTLMRKLFTNEEILNHSVSGKAANSKTSAKPKFESFKIDLLRKITIENHGKEVAQSITAKIQAVQKAVKRGLNEQS